MTVLEEAIVSALDADILLLEWGEANGARYETAQFLIDAHSILRNLIDEYRNRVMSAQGLKVEFLQRLQEYRRERDSDTF